MISIKHGNNQVLISINDIIWIEAHEQFSYIKLKGEEHKNKKYITKSSLKKIETQLCSSHPNFVRVSKFFIINMKEANAIERVTTNTNGKKEFVKFKCDNKSISIGRGYKKNFRRYFLEI